MTLLEEVERLLLKQFQESPKFKGLIRALVRPSCDIDESLKKMIDGKWIDEATGKRLDILGRLVGQPRNQMSDKDYRAWIDVRIKLNTSHGRPEDVLTILRILLGAKFPLKMYERKQRDVVFTFFAPPAAPISPLLNITREAVPITVKCHFIKAEHATPFQFNISSFSNAALAEFYRE